MTGLWLWLCWWVWSIASNSRSKIISEKSVTNARATVSTEISQPINVDLCSILNFPPYWILNERGLDMSTLIGKQDRLAFWVIKPTKSQMQQESLEARKLFKTAFHGRSISDTKGTIHHFAVALSLHQIVSWQLLIVSWTRSVFILIKLSDKTISSQHIAKMPNMEEVATRQEFLKFKLERTPRVVKVTKVMHINK